MPLVHPKSFVAGLLLLSVMVRELFVALHQAHLGALYKYNVVACPIFAAFCIWHSFKGKRPMFDGSELRTSLWLGSFSLIAGLGISVALVVWWPRFHHRPSGVVLGVLWLAAAAYYFRTALQERRAIQDSPPFGTKGWLSKE
jgi:hypothetical protein